ncbi:hypothetical protein ACH4TX_39210 [Streptomyces sp. NPDC021098]|uniref:hypothetical protein n=1 Tax=unclassified Streptomyces TaxID=2593676 RepID=UPI003796B917
MDKAQGGEVIAYEPRLDGGRMVVPVTISNEGKQRASYEVTVTAVGNTGSSAVTVTKKAPGVFPGSTWPTQADVTTSEVKDAKELKITLRVVKENYGR